MAGPRKKIFKTEKKLSSKDSAPAKDIKLDGTSIREYAEDSRSHEYAIKDFEAYEAMANAQTYDMESRRVGSGITDSATATIYLERASRVAGQLPIGQVDALGQKDIGKALFMDMLRLKWIYPNANAQRSFKTKLFLWQYGSSQYGFMPMHYDLDTSPSGYTGPNCWLENPRNVIPQAGLTTVADMDYLHHDAFKTPSFFEDIVADSDANDWNKDVIRALLPKFKTTTKEADTTSDTKAQQDKNVGGQHLIKVTTRYEAGEDGHWVTFLPDHGHAVIRDIKNPHENGRIPFVIKPCIPSFDSWYSVGDFQRSMPMQFVNDGLDAFYFEGIKINLYPPTVLNTQTVIAHTIDQEPGAIWEFNGSPDVKRLETSTAGLATYQNAKGLARGAIQSGAGVTDTRPNAENSMDPGMGKTPQALEMIQARENTRDAQDRELLEEALTELMDGMLSIVPTVSSKIPLDLLASEVREIMQDYPDLNDMLKKVGPNGEKLVTAEPADSRKQTRFIIDPDKLKGLEYRFQLEPGSTAKQNRQEQLQSMTDFMAFISKMPNALQDYRAATNQIPNWPFIFRKFGELADVPGMDQMFIQAPEPQQPETPTETPEPAQTAPSPEQQAAMEAAMAAGSPPQAVAPPVAVAPAPAPEMPPPVEDPNDPMVVGGVRFSSPELAERARQLMAERNR